MALCSILEEQQNRRHELRTIARRVSLQHLIAATNSADLRTDWIRVSDNFGDLFQQPGDIEDFRNAAHNRSMVWPIRST
jgi:hypothetical protein